MCYNRDRSSFISGHNQLYYGNNAGTRSLFSGKDNEVVWSIFRNSNRFSEWKWQTEERGRHLLDLHHKWKEDFIYRKDVADWVWWLMSLFSPLKINLFSQSSASPYFFLIRLYRHCSVRLQFVRIFGSTSKLLFPSAWGSSANIRHPHTHQPYE